MRKGGRSSSPFAWRDETGNPEASAPRDVFDEEYAATLVGKYILVGLTYLDHEGAFIEQRQVHGRIVSADKRDGFLIELHGVRAGEMYRLPPGMRSFEEAAAGEYRLRSTGEVVVDPDVLCKWIVQDAEPGSLSPRVPTS